jgi:hypothetical protein
VKKLQKKSDDYHSTYIGNKDIMDKCCLSNEELDEYLEMTEHIDPKDEHDHLYRTMMNQTRRNLLKFIDTDARTIHEIRDNVHLADEQLQYHLSMLEQLFFVMNTESGWKNTPRGLGFLYYTILE